MGRGEHRKRDVMAFWAAALAQPDEAIIFTAFHFRVGGRGRIAIGEIAAWDGKRDANIVIGRREPGPWYGRLVRMVDGRADVEYAGSGTEDEVRRGILRLAEAHRMTVVEEFHRRVPSNVELGRWAERGAKSKDALFEKDGTRKRWGWMGAGRGQNDDARHGAGPSRA